LKGSAYLLNLFQVVQVCRRPRTRFSLYLAIIIFLDNIRQTAFCRDDLPRAAAPVELNIQVQVQINFDVYIGTSRGGVDSAIASGTYRPLSERKIPEANDIYEHNTE
jgi:hypothetical protein